jgi:hypothetical protein
MMVRAFGNVLVRFDDDQAIVILPRGEVADDLLGMVELSDDPAEAAAELIGGALIRGTDGAAALAWSEAAGYDTTKLLDDDTPYDGTLSFEEEVS